MKILYSLLLISAAAAMAACSPRVGMMTSKKYPVVDPTEPFVFVHDKNEVPVNALNLGWFTSEKMDGDSAAIFLFAKIQTTQAGGNAFYVTKAARPSAKAAAAGEPYDLQGFMLRMPGRLDLSTLKGAMLVHDTLGATQRAAEMKEFLRGATTTPDGFAFLDPDKALPFGSDTLGRWDSEAQQDSQRSDSTKVYNWAKAATNAKGGNAFQVQAINDRDRTSYGLSGTMLAVNQN